MWPTPTCVNHAKVPKHPNEWQKEIVGAMSEHRERLTRFYHKYNADKLHEIDGVLERFKGRETQLFSALVKKYGPEPGDSDDEEAEEQEIAPSAAQNAEAAEPEENSLNHQRLLAFYQKYNPDKLHDVPHVLAKYKGKESKLFDALVRKYGPEPGDSDDEEEEEHEEDEEEGEEDGLPKMRHVLYCPYGPMFKECKPWLAEHCPDLVLSKYNRTVTELLEVEQQIADGVEGITLEVQGKTVKKKKKNKIEEAAKRKENCMVTISKSSRKGRKRLTFVTGLEDFEGVNIKDACKSMGKKFACSSSLSKTDQGQQQIQLQGDCVTELLEVLPEMFGVHEDQINVIEEPIKAAKPAGKGKGGKK
jgi:density-regulated protein DRP1